MSRRDWLLRMGRVTAVLILILFTVLLLISYRRVRGWGAEVVISGSMRPAILPGSVVIHKELPPNHYQVGDVITFYPPYRERQLVTHRIVALYENSSGILVAKTKGDANTNGDPWLISVGSIRGKQVIALPWLGYLFQVVKTPIGFLVFTLTFFLFLILEELQFIGGWLLGRAAKV